MKEGYTARIAEIEAQAEAVRQDMGKELEGASHEWIDRFREYRNLTELTRYTVVTLIDRILIYRDHRIEIQFRWQDEFQWQTELLAQAMGRTSEKGAG